MFTQYSDAIALPQLIRLKENLVIAKFELMKILPAQYIIEKAIRNHEITRDSSVVETSSGTFALGIGIVCAERKIPFYIISDPAIDPLLSERLFQLGGTVEILSEKKCMENPQKTRLEAVHTYLKENPKVFWTRQYDNPDNQASYAIFGTFLLKELGKNFTLISAVGSGGSASGTIQKIRTQNPAARLVGVDTPGSVLFGLKNKPRILRGLGNSLLPKNVCHADFDEIHWVTGNDAFYYTQKLHREKALFCGPTTGANYQVADWLSDQYPHELFVFISADTGHRYQETVYNQDWLKKNNLLESVTPCPTEVQHPREVGETWSRFQWNRQSYQSVMGTL